MFKMKRRTQTLLLLVVLACIIYVCDILSMLSFELPDADSIQLSRNNNRGKKRNAAADSSWRKPRWPSKTSLEEEEAEEKRYNKFKGPTSKKKKKRSKKNAGQDAEIAANPHKGTRFLLPISLGNQGPNNQLQSLKFSAAVAILHNYTLVLPPFFEHQSGKLQTVPKQRTFEETMDWQPLNEIVPVISLEGFRTICGGKVETVMVGTAHGRSQTDEERESLEEYEDQVSQVFGTLTKLSIPSILKDKDKVLNLPDGSPKHFIHVEDFVKRFPAAFNSSSTCNAFLHPYGMVGRFGYRSFLDLFQEHFIRAEYIRTVADKFIKQFLGDRYLCMHWRFDQEWVDFWCTQKHGRYYCPILQTTPATQVIEKLLALLQQQQINAVYYASPIEQHKDGVLANLRANLQYLFTRVNVLNSPIPEAEWFRGDNYRMSLLEQEICKRSEFFIASELSSWSDMVIEDRMGVSVMRVTDVIK